MKKEGNKAEKADVKNEELGNKEQEINQSRILRNLLLVIGIIALVFAGYLIFSYTSSNFAYRDVGFSIVKDEWIPTGLYATKIPVTYNGTKADYNFYLRNDPRQLAEEVPFNGSLYIRPLMVINMTDGLNCNGDLTISLANMIGLYKVMGTNTVQDANATCDNQSRYVYMNIQTSNETSIKETAPACYTVNVNNCEILKATERYMAETFVELQKYIKK